MTAISKIRRTRFNIYKGKKNRNIFLYKYPDTFQKAIRFQLRFINKKHDTLRYAIFHEIFGVGVYIQTA